MPTMSDTTRADIPHSVFAVSLVMPVSAPLLVACYYAALNGAVPAERGRREMPMIRSLRREDESDSDGEDSSGSEDDDDDDEEDDENEEDQEGRGRERDTDTSGSDARSAHARTYAIRYHRKTHYRIVYEEIPTVVDTRGSGDSVSSVEAQEV